MADGMRAATPAIKKSLITLFAVTSFVLCCVEASAWQTNVTGTAGGGQFNATAVDGSGNVIAAGFTTNSDTGNAFTVAKFDGAGGMELWRDTITSTNQAKAVVVDGAGNVVAAGGPPFTVAKLGGAAGAELWQQVPRDTAGSVGGAANAVAVDEIGNVVAAGSMRRQIHPGCTLEGFVTKLDGASGAELWRQFFGAGCNGIPSEARAVAVDGIGNVVVTGRSVAGAAAMFTVLKLDGVTGTTLWSKTVLGTQSPIGEGRAVAIDADGNVVAAGYTTNTGTGPDFTVVKFDGVTGVELWRQAINGSSNGSDFANAVTVDETGNVVAGGTLNQIVNDPLLGPVQIPHWAVIKFDGVDGAELWRSTVASNASEAPNETAATAVAVDKTDNVVATGFRSVPQYTYFTVIKYDGPSGAVLWNQSVTNQAGGPGKGYAVVIDGTGNVIAAGHVSSTATVAKLRGTDGSDFVSPDTEPPTATITAPANGAIVSGTITVSADASDNVGVVGVQFKLDGAPLGAEDTAAPYAVTWDTTTATVGQHMLTAVARDAAGNRSACAPVTVVVVNLP